MPAADSHCHYAIAITPLIRYAMPATHCFTIRHYADDRRRRHYAAATPPQPLEIAIIRHAALMAPPLILITPILPHGCATLRYLRAAAIRCVMTPLPPLRHTATIRHYAAAPPLLLRASLRHITAAICLCSPLLYFCHYDIDYCHVYALTLRFDTPVITHCYRYYYAAADYA